MNISPERSFLVGGLCLLITVNPGRMGWAADIELDIGPDSTAPLQSMWADYFGTHYASSPKGAGTVWNTVRSYGGTHIGIRDETPDAPPRIGPFAGREVR